MNYENMNKEDQILYKGISYAIENWSSIIICRKYQLGGDKMEEKIKWLINVIFENVKLAKDSYELWDLLCEIFEDEFQLQIEDGSGPIFCKDIYDFYRDIVAKQNFALDDLFKKIPELTKSNLRIESNASENKDSDLDNKIYDNDSDLNSDSSL